MMKTLAMRSPACYYYMKDSDLMSDNNHIRGRASWIDRWKGILILSVVLGHVSGGGGNICSEASVSVLWGIRDGIYAFHMPAFFILAGFCWRKSDDWITFLQKKAVRLLVPYLIFGLFSWMVYDVVYGAWGELGWQMISMIHGGNWPDGNGFKCNSVLWFLPVMFTVLVAYRFLESRIKSNIIFWKIILCAALWFLRILCYRYRILFLPFGLDLVLWYLPYFIIGTMSGGLFREVKTWKLCVCSMVVFAIMWFLKFYAPPQRLASLQGFLYAISLALSGTCVSLCVAKARWWNVVLMSWCGGGLAKIGVASMGIMLLHKFPVVALQERIGVIRNMFSGNSVEGIAGMTLVFVVATAGSYYVTLIVRRYASWMLGENRN